MSNDKAIDDDALGSTLFSIGYVGRNGGPALQKRSSVIAKFAGNKSKSVASAAKFECSK